LDDVSDLALFRTIVDAGGISAAALLLQSSPPAVSRRLSALEAKLGVKLAERSSRRFRLTEEGLLLYERSRAIIGEIRDLHAEVASRGGSARGRLAVGAPTDLGRRHIAPHLARFVAMHPGLDGHLVLSDAGLEVEADGLDLALRFGLPSDPWAIVRKIATTRRVLCASPSYIARRGMPDCLEQLASHACLRITRRNQVFDRWVFTKAPDPQREFKVTGALASGDGSVLREWALSGEGIVLEALWDVADDLAHGRLVQILPEYRAPDLELYAVLVPTKPTPPKIRLFSDYLAHYFRHPPPEGIGAVAGAQPGTPG
jgi:LysR family transcriptional activator of dmlA